MLIIGQQIYNICMDPSLLLKHFIDWKKNQKMNRTECCRHRWQIIYLLLSYIMICIRMEQSHHTECLYVLVYGTHGSPLMFSNPVAAYILSSEREYLCSGTIATGQSQQPHLLNTSSVASKQACWQDGWMPGNTVEFYQWRCCTGCLFFF